MGKWFNNIHPDYFDGMNKSLNATEVEGNGWYTKLVH